MNSETQEIRGESQIDVLIVYSIVESNWYAMNTCNC